MKKILAILTVCMLMTTIAVHAQSTVVVRRPGLLTDLIGVTGALLTLPIAVAEGVALGVAETADALLTGTETVYYTAPAPVYTAPAPVVVAPAPVVVAPAVVNPAPVYVAPAPVVVAPPVVQTTTVTRTVTTTRTTVTRPAYDVVVPPRRVVVRHRW